MAYNNNYNKSVHAIRRGYIEGVGHEVDVHNKRVAEIKRKRYAELVKIHHRHQMMKGGQS